MQLPRISLFLLASVALAQTEFTVAPDGNDANPGSRAAPFAGLERARDEIRALKKAGGLPAGGVTVILRGGVYERSRVFELGREDSGTAAAPIVYRAAPGETAILLGGKIVRDWKPVTDPGVLAHLPATSRDKVWQADLKKQGISDLGIVAVQDRKKEKGDQRFELYFNGMPMTLSRYPNDGFLRVVDLLGGTPRVVRSTRGDAIGKFTCDSDRLARWVDEKDPWVHGYWYWDWSDQRHRIKTLDPPRRYIEVEPPYHAYGYRKGQWFYAFNLLAEIDQPGEWYLDRETGMLYFYPPAPLDKGSAMVSIARTLLSLQDVSHVTFERLTFEVVRGTAVDVRRCRDCEIAACTIRNTGVQSVSIRDGKHCGVVGCEITNSGGSGISLWGGDRRTLTPAGHYAINNHIYHYGLWKRMYSKAIGMGGVGQRAVHNLIHDAPHQAIGFWGNDHLIEFNEIHSVCFESNDAGAIYAGRDWTARGTVIRHNYLHHISGFRGRGCVGVYLDDMFCGTEISGNVFYRVTRAAFIGGGRDCLVENNIFVDCPRALHIDARALGWAHACADRWIEEAKTKGTISGFKYNAPPYSTRWPKLATILEHEPKAPEGNVIRRNIFYGEHWNDITGRARPYQTLENNLIDEDPRFVDYKKHDFHLRNDSPAYTKIGFKRIPIEKIGLYNDARRALWPVENKVRPMPAPAPKPQARKGPAPMFKVGRITTPPHIDGVLARGEWPQHSLPLAVDVYGRPATRRSTAWLAHDDTFLYLAVRNEVDPAKPLKREAKWGVNDAVELAFRNPARGSHAPILLLRAYPCGAFEGSTEAGAPADETDTLAAATTCAVKVLDAATWVTEWRIPLSALGLDPAKPAKLQFNLSVRKTADNLWLMWVGTRTYTWEVNNAGRLSLE